MDMEKTSRTPSMEQRVMIIYDMNHRPDLNHLLSKKIKVHQSSKLGNFFHLNSFIRTNENLFVSVTPWNYIICPIWTAE
jgi:hypothetical protein